MHFTWLFRLDAQIAETYGEPEWPLKQYASLVEKTRNQGDEIGIHTHPYRWDIQREEWIAEYGDQDWVDFCLRLSFDAYRRCLGENPRSCSMGNQWMNNETVKTLEELGAKYDLTLLSETDSKGFTPELGRFTGNFQSYKNVPWYPYHPATDDFRVPDNQKESGFWMIPAPTQMVKRRGERIQSLVEFAKRKIRRQPKPTSKFLIRKGPASFRDSFDYLIEKSEHPYCLFTLRTALFGIPQLVERLNDCFDFLLSHPHSKRFVFTTPAELIESLSRVQSSQQEAERVCT